MKICPICSRCFEDELEYCNEDGTELETLEEGPIAPLQSRYRRIWISLFFICLMVVGLGIWTYRSTLDPNLGLADTGALSTPSPGQSSIPTVAPEATAKPVETRSQQATQRQELNSGDYPGERFPQTRQRSLSESEVAQMGYSDTRYAINEIYARHGYAFQKTSIRRQFSGFSWYHPAEGMGMEDVEQNRLSRLEFDNARVLAVRRQALEAQGAGD